jgi:hypothetical protein
MAAAILGVAGFLATDPAPSIASQLVSVTGVDLKPDVYLWDLKIDISHARIIAVCNVLPGWQFQLKNYGEAGDYHDGGAHFSGEANVGHHAITSNSLGQLRGLLLIERDSETGAVALHGSIHVEGIGAAETEKASGDYEVAFKLETATRCP